MKTYSELRKLTNILTNAQVGLVQEFLWEMDDDEFSQIPTILFAPDAKKILETYGIIMSVLRKNPKPTSGNDEKITHTIYCLFPSIFKIII